VLPQVAKKKKFYKIATRPFQALWISVIIFPSVGM
jgi:hypothetical protein